MATKDAISVFDHRTLSYSYENGWAFTNFFEGHTRVSTVEGRGELREQIEITELRPNLFFAAWIDDEMGALSQIIDLENMTVEVAIPMNGAIEIWHGTITAFDG